MTKNKLIKYSVYAIGEIVLIVLGILIAFWLSNWNQRRADVDIERALLGELHTEFRYNLEIIKGQKEIWKDIKNATDSLLLFTGKPADSSAHVNLDNMIFRSSLHNFFEPSDHALQEALNSGKHNLINHRNLRIELFQWTSQRDALKHMLDSRQAVVMDNYLPYLNEVMNYRNSDYRSGTRADSSLIPDSFVAYDLMNVRIFENHILIDNYNLALIVNSFDLLEDRVVSIREKIDERLSQIE